MQHEESKVSKQVNFWKLLGFYSPLVFVGAGVVFYFAEYLKLHDIMVAGGTFAATVTIIWWWWALHTIKRLDNVLRENTKNFQEMVSIVKDLNQSIHESDSSTRKRRKPKAAQSKTDSTE
jgi:hypothetical protein